ncbi:MAG: patatin-like phospholipase family protein [Thermoanaerobaculia bacterium]
MSPSAQQAALAPVLAHGAREDRQAVVLSSGGANGAYEVGVLRALFEGASPATGGVPLSVDVFTGTSVGAYNAAFMAQAQGTGLEASQALEQVWCQRIADTPASCGNGVYRLRADPRRWIDPGCLRHPVDLLLSTAADTAFWAQYALQRAPYVLNALISTQDPVIEAIKTLDFAALFSEAPLDALIKETIDPGLLARSPKDLSVTATDWVNGRPRVFSKADIVHRYGTDAIKASTAIPGIFPPVPLDGTWMVDGGLLMSTPLKPAIDAGSDVLHVVYVDPLVVDIPFPELPTSLDTLYRVYVIVVAANMNNDLFVAQLVDEDLELAERLGVVRQGRPGAALGPGLRRLRRVVQHAEQGEPYRPLTVHRYRPHTPLGSADALLNFSIDHITAAIAQGYQDALRHDCTAEQCVLPPALATEAGLEVRPA